MRILIADDDENGLLVLERSLRYHGYDVDTAINGEIALEQAEQHCPDLIITDIMMPKMDGFELCRHLKRDAQLKSIPVIFYTATYIDAESKALSHSLGVEHFIIKPLPHNELLELIDHTLEKKILNHLKQTDTDIDFTDVSERHELILTNKLTKRNEQLEVERQKLFKMNEALRNTLETLDLAHQRIKIRYLETIQRLTLASEYKDNETGAHIKRTSLYCKFIAEELGLDSTFIETIYYTAPMHDLGKVGIPDSILLKNGPLDKDEWEILMTHPKIGADILGGSDSSYLKMAEDIAYTHHETWDGTGYPRKLKGEEIPISGRIMILADQYDALRSKRPYKSALEHEQATKVLTEGDGRTSPQHFDPDILEIFKKNNQYFYDISISIKD